MFAVVRFKEDDSTSEVPTQWLCDNNNKCWWPPNKNVSSFIKNTAAPNKKTWQKHNIVVETFCDSIKVARRKAEDGNYTENEDSCKKKRLCKKKNMDDYFISKSSDSEDELNQRKLPAPPKLPPLQKAMESTNTNSSSSQNNAIPFIIIGPTHSEPHSSFVNTLSDDNLETPSDDLNVCAPSFSKGERTFSCNTPVGPVTTQPGGLSLDEPSDIQNVPAEPENREKLVKIIAVGPVTTQPGLDLEESSDVQDEPSVSFVDDLGLDLQTLPKDLTTKLLMKILRVTTELKLQMEQLLSTQQTSGTAKKTSGVETHLPLKNLEELEEFERHLAKTEVKTTFTNYLGTIGGSSAKEMICRILKKIFPDEFAVKCSWLGYRNNIKIFDRMVIGCMKDAVFHKFSLTEKDFEIVSAEWFRQSGQRLKRQQLRV